MAHNRSRDDSRDIQVNMATKEREKLGTKKKEKATKLTTRQKKTIKKYKQAKQRKGNLVF